MIIVTIAFPDERVDWIDHLHATFPDQRSADRWIRSLESLGKLEHAQETGTSSWKCPVCHARAAKVSRPMAAVGQEE